jgi:hypothetical protein
MELFLIAAASAQAPSSGSMLASRLTKASATVTRIDKKQRTVWLKNDRGEEFPISVGSDVRNFDQIRVGDRVNVQYQESMVASIRKPGEPAPPTGEKEQTQRGPAGERPSGTLTRETTMTAQVVSVDPAQHTLALRGPQGRTRTFMVNDPTLQGRLSSLKPGDQIDITYSEATAVSVEPATTPR